MSIRSSIAASLSISRQRIRQAPRRVLATWFLQAVVLLIVRSLLPGVLVDDLLSPSSRRRSSRA